MKQPLDEALAAFKARLAAFLGTDESTATVIGIDPAHVARRHPDGWRPGVWQTLGRLHLQRETLRRYFGGQGPDECCVRVGEYNGFGSDGPTSFVCPKGCPCHD